VLKLETLDIKHIDNSDPLNKAELAIGVSSGTYTRADITGHVAPFANKANLDLEIKIREFGLPEISPFIRTATGFDMTTGQLDSDTTLTVVNDEIDGVAQLQMRGLEIENSEEQGALVSQTFIPLNVALGVLEDSDGVIEIEVPLKGNVNSPQFGIEGFLNLVAQQAALLASQTYLINTFVPYANIITLTNIAGNYALKPRVDDLIFEEGKSELDSDQKEFLDQLALLLEDKSDINMKACGFASASEQEGARETLSPTQRAALRELALKRSLSVKNYLVADKGIASARILICQAKVEQADAAHPRVEFEF